MRKNTQDRLTDSMRAVRLASGLVQTLNRAGELAGELDALLNDDNANLDGLRGCADDWREDVGGALLAVLGSLWAARTAAELIENSGPPLNDHDLAKRYLSRKGN